MDNSIEPSGYTPLISCIHACHSRSARIVRLLVDLGADTTSAVRITDTEGQKEESNDTPLAFAN